MSLPDIGSLDGLSLAEFRELVGVLIGEVRRLQVDNQALRDEVARLKGLPPRPPSRNYPRPCHARKSLIPLVNKPI